MTPKAPRTLLNIVWLIAERLARIGAGLAVGIVVARHLQPAGYGKISFIQAVVAVAATIAGMGLEPILMKELIAGKHPRPIAYSTALGIGGVASIAVTLLGMAAVWMFVSDPELRFLFLIAFSLLPIQGAALISVPLQAQEKFPLLVRRQLIQILLSIALRLVLVWNDAGLAWFMAAFTFDAAVWLLLLVHLRSGDSVRFTRQHIDLPLARALATDAAPLFVTNLVVMLQIRVDQFLLGILSSAAAVGSFSVASKVAEGLMLAPSIVVRALNPQLLKAKAESDVAFEQCLRRQYELSIMVAVIVALGMSLCSGLLIKVLFGPAYANAALPLAVLSWIVVPMTIGSVNANASVAGGQTRQTLVKATLGLVLNAGLNYLMIPRFGATGSAVATLMSHLASAYFGILLFEQQRHQFRYASRALLVPVTVYRYRADIAAVVLRKK